MTAYNLYQLLPKAMHIPTHLGRHCIAPAPYYMIPLRLYEFLPLAIIGNEAYTFCMSVIPATKLTYIISLSNFQIR